MPFYYSFTRPVTTNATTNTLSTHFQLLTVANQLAVRLVGLYAGARMSSAGGGVLKVTRGGAAGSGGTAIAAPNGINKRNPDNPAAGVGIVTDATAITPGTTPGLQLNVGFAQTGGQGGWVALDPDHAILLKPNGGANGNLEIGSMAVGVSQTVEISGEFSEG